jgi:hypothetical protein
MRLSSAVAPKTPPGTPSALPAARFTDGERIHSERLQPARRRPGRDAKVRALAKERGRWNRRLGQALQLMGTSDAPSCPQKRDSAG